MISKGKFVVVVTSVRVIVCGSVRASVTSSIKILGEEGKGSLELLLSSAMGSFKL